MPALLRRVRSTSVFTSHRSRNDRPPRVVGRLLLVLWLTITTALGLALTSASTAAADTVVTPFADVESTANGCESVIITSIEPSVGVHYFRVLTDTALSFPVTLRYDSTGTVALRAEATAGYSLSGSASTVLRAPASCFPDRSFDVEPQTGTAPTWCSADPDAAITVFVNGDYLDEGESLSWRLVPQSTDPDEAPVATGSLPADLFLGEASIARPDGIGLGRYDLEFQVPGGQGFPVASIPVLAADCVRLSLACGVATFTNPDSNGEASVNVLPAGGGFSEARNVTVPSGGRGSIDVSDLTDGFGWVATSDDGEIGRDAVVAASGPCALSGTRPEITGDAAWGSRLRAVAGDWQPAPVELSYQWYRDSRRIPGATGPTHRVNVADLGHRLKVRVTGHKDGYPDLSLVSAATDRAEFTRRLPRVPWLR